MKLRYFILGISVLFQTSLSVDPGHTNESYFFGVMETIFVGWFTFIFVTRLLLAPDKVEFKRNVRRNFFHFQIQFFMNFLNIIDLFGILPRIRKNVTLFYKIYFNMLPKIHINKKFITVHNKQTYKFRVGDNFGP